MERETTNLRIRSDYKNRARATINHGVVPGVNNMSALVEKALIEFFEKYQVPEKFEDKDEEE